MDNRWASRKFILACLGVISADAFLIAGLIDAAQWLSFTTISMAAYYAANVGDQAVTK